MIKKRIIKIGTFVLIALLLNAFVINYAEINISPKLSLEVSGEEKDEFQIFYDENMEWQEQYSQKYEYKGENHKQKFEFQIPDKMMNIRIDLGNNSNSTELWNLCLVYGNEKIDLLSKFIQSDVKNDIDKMSKKQDSVEIIKNGNDSYVVLNLTQEIGVIKNEFEVKLNKIVKLICLIFVNALIAIIGLNRKYVFSIIKEIYNNKILVWNLSKNDFKTKYAGSYLGIFWAFVNPIVTILIYWFVFEFGLKAGAPIPNVPFILWFTSGLIPWFFFSDAVLNATNSFIEYSYLVKKVVFKISILPIIKIFSALFIHVVFVIVMLVIYAIYGKILTLSSIQLLYYTFCTFALALSISYATSAMIIFFKDLSQIIGIALQIGMWMTPIMWSYTIIPYKFQWIAKINPMFYIVEGYRKSLLENTLFFKDFWGTLYFWSFTTLVFVVGMIIFKKLKPHFSDVL